MKVSKLKEILNNLPDECEDYDVIFGECVIGDKIRSIKIKGKKIVVAYV
jgi:hypothetical protein